MIEMEYADGGALDQYLSRLSSPMSEYSILPVLEQMASALDYIHHRDKPILHRCQPYFSRNIGHCHDLFFLFIYSFFFK